MSRLLSLQPCCPYDEYTTHFVQRASNWHLSAVKPGLFLYCCSRMPLSTITFLYFVVIHSWPAAMSSICIERIVCERITLLSFASYYPVRFCVRISIHMSTVPQQIVCLSCCLVLSKGVYKPPRVNRIATGSLYIDQTCCYPMSLVPLLLNFGGVRALSTPKLGGDVDTMSPEPTRLGKMSKPLLPSRLRFWKLCSGISGDCNVQNSPRSLLLHIPQTDPPRRIYRLADSLQRDFGRPRWMVL